MKKKALAIAIASALASPSAWAAQDTSGMHYTSAAEGFYASIRAQLDFASGDNGANINANSSRIGIRGTNDLGGGMEGFYQWEAQVGITDGETSNSGNFRTRLGNVGLRGGFGEVVVGSFWTNDYNWTHGSTDVANWFSGSLNYSDQREARSERSIQYSTPDLNGFQGAILFKAENTADSGNPGVSCAGTADTPGTTTPTNVQVVLPDDGVCPDNFTLVGADGEDARAPREDDNDLDIWNLAAKYEIQGFTVAGSWNVQADAQNTAAGGTEDLTSWTARLGYAQDNWYVTGWYGVDDYSERNTDGYDDQENLSIAGGVAVDKVSVYGVYETADNADGGRVGVEDTYGTIGVQYNLGSRSRVWIEYFNRDLESDVDADDVINIGLRHDF